MCKRWFNGPALGAALLAGFVIMMTPSTGFTQDEGTTAEVRAREIAFAHTMASRDLDAFGTFISAEAIFFNGNQPLRGRDAIIEAWSAFFDGEAAPFSWAPDVVEVLDSGRLALSSGPVLNAAGEQAGRFNSIWRKESDGQWRVIFDKGS